MLSQMHGSARRDPLWDKIREVGRGLSLADTQTSCAMGAETYVDVHMLALVCVMNDVVVPVLLVALLARYFLRRGAAPLFLANFLRQPQGRQSSPLTMHAAVCCALGRRVSLSDSALLGDARRPLSPVREHGTRD